MNTYSILQTARAIMAKQEQQPLTYKGGNHTGVMVALFPNPEIAQMLSEFGTEAPGDLHITLAYLGKAQDLVDPEGLVSIVATFARSQAPLSGHINGVGRFNMIDPEKSDVYIALPDLPNLPDLRQDLVNGLDYLGYPLASEHGFIPHITLSYLNRDEATPTYHIPPYELFFDKLSVVIAGQRSDFYLGHGVEKAGARNSWVDLGRIQKVHDLTVELGAVCKRENAMTIDKAFALANEGDVILLGHGTHTISEDLTLVKKKELDQVAIGHTQAGPAKKAAQEKGEGLES